MVNNKRLYIYHTFLSRRKDLGHFHSIKDLTNQLDYIQEMGFTAILTNPIFESADDSHGYHCINFYEIDHRLGTTEDFENLLKELKKRNMSFIMDITLNHCSDQSYYFKDFVAGKNDFFVTKNTPVNDRATNIRGSIYEWRADLNKYIVAPFGGMIPALNVSSPNVKNEMKNVLEFWLKKSPTNMHLRGDAIFHNSWAVDNFDGLPYCRFIRDVVNGINPEIQIIGEVWYDVTYHDLKYTPMEYNRILGNTFDFYNVFGLVNQIREGKSYNELHIDSIYPKSVSLFSCNHDCSRISSMLDNNREKVKLFLKAMIEKTRDEDSISIYYGTENDMEGLLWNCSDTVVRQNFDITDMAKVIKDKNSLFYYIKDLIYNDKKRRGLI